MNEELELRTSIGAVNIETRADGKEEFTGEAVVFNQMSQLLGGWFKEQIDPRAFDDCDMSNVVGLFNHSENQILGRTQSGTLTLEKTDRGLNYRIAYDPADPDHVRLRAKINRGDVRGSSFAFRVAPRGSDWDTDPTSGTEIRTVKKIAVLVDVSPVVNPAYLQTSAGMNSRSLADLKAERDEALSARNQTDNAQADEPAVSADADQPFGSTEADHDKMLMELSM